MKTKSLLVCSVLLLACGCGKEVENSEPATQAPPPPLEAVSAAPANVAPRAILSSAPQPAANVPPISPIVAPQPVAVPADTTAALGVLTQAVRRFSAENRRVPKSLSEVIIAGYVTSLPKAPAGKKYVLNTKRLEVILEND